VSEARTVAMALCRLLGGYPLRKIGAAFGDVSYTGVATAVARVRKRRQQDDYFQQTLLQLKQTLEDKYD
jgi:chromosomal replication initiation ATPase DnaA